MTSKLKNLLELKNVQAAALESNEVAQFHITVRGRDIHHDCKHLGWKKTRDSLQFGREHPICQSPDKVKEYVVCKAMILSCEGCPFYTKDN